MRFLAPIAAVVVALVAGACGSQGELSTAPETIVGSVPQDTGAGAEPVEVPEGDAAAGAEVFASAGCGGCHTLADAGTSGNVGPNLDETQPDAAKVYDRVLNGQGAMPSFKDQLSEQQIADVTAYVVQSTSG